MRVWLERRVRAIRNRIRKFRKSAAYDTFIGVFWALVAFEALKLFAAPFLAG